MYKNRKIAFDKNIEKIKKMIIMLISPNNVVERQKNKIAIWNEKHWYQRQL
tara:strand:- start:186 stop:338 length:153 start_codon:yes stop_codon:yes gene_type:complete